MEYGKHGMEYKIKYYLIGIGDIRIRPEYKHVFVDPVHFSKLTSNQKEKYLKKLETFNPVDYKKYFIFHSIPGFRYTHINNI